MSTQTTNYGFIKDDPEEFYDVLKVNANLDKIDIQIKTNENNITNLAGAGRTTETVRGVSDALDSHKADNMYQTAGGTATAITLTISGTLVTGYPITFIASADNGGAATTINGKPLYKPGTTTSPTLKSGKAYTVWYNSTANSGNGCFFIKASATGTATTAQVLAGVPYSNENDTDLVGTMPNNGILSATLVNQGQSYAIPSGYVAGGTVTTNITNLVAGNIANGVNVGGITGTFSTTVFTTGTTLSILYDNTQKFLPYNVMTKVKEFKINYSGVVNIKIYMNTQGSASSSYAQIYVNGVARGTLRSIVYPTLSSTTYEDITVNPNDLIQVYGYTTVSDTGYIGSFGITANALVYGTQTLV